METRNIILHEETLALVNKSHIQRRQIEANLPVKRQISFVNKP